MYVQKTIKTLDSVQEYLKNIGDESRVNDAEKLIQIMQDETGHEPKMWGTSIVGFGKYHYKYASGHEGESCLTGFAFRKNYIVLYLMHGVADRKDLIKKLGKVKTSVGCIYVKNLQNLDLSLLSELIKYSVRQLIKMYPDSKS